MRPKSAVPALSRRLRATFRNKREAENARSLRTQEPRGQQRNVDKVELVPFSAQTIPRIDSLHVDKRSIGWREEQIVEVRALLTVAVGPTGPPTEHKTITLEVKLFDNTGRQVGRYENGMLAAHHP